MSVKFEEQRKNNVQNAIWKNLIQMIEKEVQRC